MQYCLYPTMCLNVSSCIWCECMVLQEGLCNHLRSLHFILLFVCLPGRRSGQRSRLTKQFERVQIVSGQGNGELAHLTSVFKVSSFNELNVSSSFNNVSSFMCLECVYKLDCDLEALCLPAGAITNHRCVFNSGSAK